MISEYTTGILKELPVKQKRAMLRLIQELGVEWNIRNIKTNSIGESINKPIKESKKSNSRFIIVRYFFSLYF